MGYLIGEKFLNFLQASDRHPEFASELPRFVEEVRAAALAGAGSRNTG